MKISEDPSTKLSTKETKEISLSNLWSFLVLMVVLLLQNMCTLFYIDTREFFFLVFVIQCSKIINFMFFTLIFPNTSLVWVPVSCALHVLCASKFGSCGYCEFSEPCSLFVCISGWYFCHFVILLTHSLTFMSRLHLVFISSNT